MGTSIRTTASRLLRGPRLDDRLPDWGSAEASSSGYADPALVAAISKAARVAHGSESVVERDGVLLPQPPIDWRLLSALLMGRSRTQATMVICDVGGSLGSKFIELRDFHELLQPFEWHVLEQPVLSRIGADQYANESLRFHPYSDRALRDLGPDVILAMSSLQYMSEPRAVLNTALTTAAKALLVQKTPFVRESADVAAVQRVRTATYKTSYPCWLLSESVKEVPAVAGWRINESWDDDDAPERTCSRRRVFWGGLVATSPGEE